MEEKFQNNGLTRVLKRTHLYRAKNRPDSFKTISPGTRWRQKALSCELKRYRAYGQGFTLIEMLVAVAMLGILAAIAIPLYQNYLDRARNSEAVSDIQVLQLKIQVYEEEQGKLPDSLSDLKWGNPDPWGHPYQYLNFSAAGPSWKGMARKDKFLVPLNSTYDLCSKGKDGKSQSPLTAPVSHDDIIRASDGGFVGLASMY